MCRKQDEHHSLARRSVTTAEERRHGNGEGDTEAAAVVGRPAGWLMPRQPKTSALVVA